MSETVVSLPLRPRAEIAGYVEAMTDTAALGWTWRSGSTERLTVELRLGPEVVANIRADGMREDLAQSGIGDGRHAFCLPIPGGLQSRASELRVVATSDDGTELVLSAPPTTATSPDTGADSIRALHRGIETLIGSQRVIHRNLQAALLQQPSVSTALAEITTAQADLRERLDTFELFAVRLEQALAQREIPARAAPTSRSLVLVAVIAGLALIGSCCALWRSALGS